MTDQHASISAILSRLREGPDPDIFAELYDETCSTVYAWACALTSTSAAAEQVVIHTYTALWCDATHYPGLPNPWAWLLSHVITAVRNNPAV